jgi:hypothetical protein
MVSVVRWNRPRDGSTDCAAPSSVWLLTKHARTGGAALAGAAAKGRELATLAHEHVVRIRFVATMVEAAVGEGARIPNGRDRVIACHERVARRARSGAETGADLLPLSTLTLELLLKIFAARKIPFTRAECIGFGAAIIAHGALFALGATMLALARNNRPALLQTDEGCRLAFASGDACLLASATRLWFAANRRKSKPKQERNRSIAHAGLRLGSKRWKKKAGHRTGGARKPTTENETRSDGTAAEPLTTHQAITKG